jgi:hypothetical protein
MRKKHIIKFHCYHFAVESITAATQAVAMLSKLQPVKYVTDGEYSGWHYAPDESGRREITLEMHQPYRDPKPEKKPKSLALPAPKKGSILCVCEKSYVAPRQSCPHCGRKFSESHNRTHNAHAATTAGLLPFPKS